MATLAVYAIYFAAVYAAVAATVDRLCPETRDMGRAARTVMLVVMSGGYGVALAVLAAMVIEAVA